MRYQKRLIWKQGDTDPSNPKQWRFKGCMRKYIFFLYPKYGLLTDRFRFRMSCALQLVVNNNKKKTTLIFSRHARLLLVWGKGRTLSVRFASVAGWFSYVWFTSVETNTVSKLAVVSNKGAGFIKKKNKIEVESRTTRLWDFRSFRLC